MAHWLSDPGHFLIYCFNSGRKYLNGDNISAIADFNRHWLSAVGPYAILTNPLNRWVEGPPLAIRLPFTWRLIMLGYLPRPLRKRQHEIMCLLPVSKIFRTKWNDRALGSAYAESQPGRRDLATWKMKENAAYVRCVWQLEWKGWMTVDDGSFHITEQRVPAIEALILFNLVKCSPVVIPAIF